MQPFELIELAALTLELKMSLLCCCHHRRRRGFKSL